MKYQTKIDLWTAGVQDKIVRGEIKLQAGQWCVCGDNEKPCRYVSHTDSGTFNVVHWQGTAARTTAAFNARIDSLRMEKLYLTDKAAWVAEFKQRRAAA